MEVFLLIVGVLLGLLVTLFVQPVIQDRADETLVRWLGTTKLRKKKSLSGPWHQRWWVESEVFPVANEDKNVVVQQFRNRIYATHVSQGRTYNTTGMVEQETYVTGTWYDEYSGPTYHGAFQLRVLPGGDTLLGKWIGFGTDGRIKSGDWEWKRPEVEKYPLDRA